MGRILFISIISSFIYSAPVIAQNNGSPPAAKPATDACPTWNNKQTISKADYLMFLRKSPKATKTNQYAQYNQPNKNFDKPLYTSLVPQRTASTNNEPVQNPTQEPIENKINPSPQIPEVPIPNIGVRSVQEITSPDTKPELKIIPQINNENRSVDSSTQASKNAVTENDKIKKKNNLFTFHKAERKHWLRKINFRKKGAAKCPDF